MLCRFVFIGEHRRYLSPLTVTVANSFRKINRFHALACFASILRKQLKARPAFAPDNLTEKTFVFTSMIMSLRKPSSHLCSQSRTFASRACKVDIGEYDIPMRFENAPPAGELLSGPRESKNNFTYFSAACRDSGGRQRSLPVVYASEEHRDVCKTLLPGATPIRFIRPCVWLDISRLICYLSALCLDNVVSGAHDALRAASVLVKLVSLTNRLYTLYLRRLVVTLF